VHAASARAIVFHDYCCCRETSRVMERICNYILMNGVALGLELVQRKGELDAIAKFV